MSEGADTHYWVRNEQGRVWGPYTSAALERMRGMINERWQAALDGVTFRPVGELAGLTALLAASKLEAHRAATATRSTSAQAPRPRGLQEVKGLGMLDLSALEALGATPFDMPEPDPAPQESSVPARAAQGSVSRPGSALDPGYPAARSEPSHELPSSGDLSATPPVRLYAQLAATAATGKLTLTPETGAALSLTFRRGAPEHLASADPSRSLGAFLLQRRVLQQEQVMAAEAHARAGSVDLTTALFQLQLISPADAHRLLGEQMRALLDRALVTWSGRYTFEKDAPSPAAAMPLGPRWALLTESVRRIEPSLLRARLANKLRRAVVRSGGLGLGKVEELALSAQEARLFASIDGVRTGEELLRAGDPGATLRVLYLLTELGHLAFASLEAGEPEPAAADPVTAPTGPAGASAAAPPSELPPRAAAPHASAPDAPLHPEPPAAQSSFVTGPPNETPVAMKIRLFALLTRLEKGTHFAALGLERDAQLADVKRAFYLLARELHPDTAPESDPAMRALKGRLFSRISDASQILSSEQARKAYEAKLDGAGSVDVAHIVAAEQTFRRVEPLVRARRYTEALQLLDEAIGLNDAEAEFHAWRGWTLFLSSKDRKLAHAAAAAHCKRALGLLDKCVPAWFFLGSMARLVGDEREALRCFQRVVELEPRHVDALRELRMGAKR